MTATAVCRSIFVSRRSLQSQRAGIEERPSVSVTRPQRLEMPCFYILLAVVAFAAGVCCNPGSCPPILSVDICAETCGPSKLCDGPKLCCPTACGGAMCVDPMTKRNFTALVKKGTCPEYPRGPWVCSHTCTSDSDCPRALKCCTNRCGALTCQKPDPYIPAVNA